VAVAPLMEFWLSFSANRGALLASLFFTVVVVCALLAGVLAPHSPIEQYREHMLTPPVWDVAGNADFLFGTDELGRDILSRLIYGARISLLIGLTSVLLSLLPGMALGLLAAFYPKRLGVVIMRVMDVMLALPSLLLAICVITVLGPGLINTTIAIAIGNLPGYTRLTRAAALSEIGREYVTASRVAGASTWRLMFNAVLPNCMAPLIVNATLGFSSSVLEAAAGSGCARISWSGRAGANTGVGRDAVGRTRLYSTRTLGGDDSGHDGIADCFVGESDGRRSAGCARSQTETRVVRENHEFIDDQKSVCRIRSWPAGISCRRWRGSGSGRR